MFKRVLGEAVGNVVVVWEKIGLRVIWHAEEGEMLTHVVWVDSVSILVAVNECF